VPAVPCVGSLRGRGHTVASATDLAFVGEHSTKSEAEPRSPPGVYKGSRSKGLEPVFFVPAVPRVGSLRGGFQPPPHNLPEFSGAVTIGG